MEGRTVDADVVVIGAGFAGLYALYKLRTAGLDVRVFERGEGLGGTWYWNRYPGARVDIQSVEYMFTKFPDLDQEWDWTELMPAQEEIERYLNWIADKLELRDGITFNTAVERATYDDATATWRVETDSGEQVVANFVVAATGCLSAPIEPVIPGLHTFSGDSLYTNRFPKEGYNFAGNRVAVIGTGSSGVQSIPVIAEQAAELFVLQRSAAYTLPSPNRPLGPNELAELKAEYADDPIRAVGVAGQGPRGLVRCRSWVGANHQHPRCVVGRAAREARRAGHGGVLRVGRRVLRHRGERSRDAAVRRGDQACRQRSADCRRSRAALPVRLQARDHRRGVLRDVQPRERPARQPPQDPIGSIKPRGIRLQDDFLELDVIVYATGFDAMTGSALAHRRARPRRSVTPRRMGRVAEGVPGFGGR